MCEVIRLTTTGGLKTAARAGVIRKCCPIRKWKLRKIIRALGLARTDRCPSLMLVRTSLILLLKALSMPAVSLGIHIPRTSTDQIWKELGGITLIFAVGNASAPREAYLAPALTRSNVTYSTNSQATRLLFDGNRCIGVEYRQNGDVLTALSANEVIVCAGVMESPKLLMLSGIGNPQYLAEFGIPVVAELSGVGENFHNHVLVGVIREASKPVPPR